MNALDKMFDKAKSLSNAAKNGKSAVKANSEIAANAAVEAQEQQVAVAKVAGKHVVAKAEQAELSDAELSDRDGAVYSTYRTNTGDVAYSANGSDAAYSRAAYGNNAVYSNTAYNNTAYTNGAYGNNAAVYSAAPTEYSAGGYGNAYGGNAYGGASAGAAEDMGQAVGGSWWPAVLGLAALGAGYYAFRSPSDSPATPAPAVVVAPTVTAALPAAGISISNVSAAPITGTTTNAPAGSTVTVVISDQATSTPDVTATATVATDGTYTVKPDLSKLADGHLYATATITTVNGSAVATGTGDLEAVQDIVTVTLPSSSLATAALSAVVVSGSTSDIPVGGTVTVTLSDASGHTTTVNAVVQNDHTYSTTTNLSSFTGTVNASAHATELTGDVINSTVATAGIAAAPSPAPTPAPTPTPTPAPTPAPAVNHAPTLDSTTDTSNAALYPTSGTATAMASSAIEGTVGLNTTGTGWHIYSYSPDIISGNGTYPNVTGSTYTNTASNIEGTSTNGGTMQSLLSQKVDFGGGAVFTNSEAVSTDFTGLTVGKSYTYTVQWQQDTVTDATKKNANFSGGQLLMQVGHVTYDANGVATLASGSTDKVYTSSGLNDGWQTATITFVADATTESVVLNINGLNGVAADALSSTNFQNGGENGGAIVVDSVGLTQAAGAATQGTGISLASFLPTTQDVDNTILKGWAITDAQADSSGGHWEYSSAGTWHTLAGASTSSAVFLTADTMVRWNGANSTHTAFSAVAVDVTNTTATEGSTVNTTSNGGSTPYSATTATLAAGTGPVVLDLNHDGVISYSHTSMDLIGNGQLVSTAWAGSQDGVLVWDRYQDGQVHDQSQYAFSQYGGATDLSGLKAFDTNGNGSLDAGDALFGQFKVWQDKNGDGKVETGEMLSLSDLGIKSIALTSNNVSSTPAAGVLEFGHAVVTHTDGSTSVAADAMFDHVSLSSKAISQLVDQTSATMHAV